MVDFFEGLRRATKAVDCALLSATGAVLGAAGSLPGGDPTFVVNSVKALRRLRGCDPAFDPEPTPPDATGGQCAVNYLCRFRWNDIATDGSAIFPAVEQDIALPGPVGAIFGSGLPEFQAIKCFYGGGIETFLRQGSCTQGCYRNIAWVSFTRVDGLPDDCGSQPPIFPPPGDTTIDIDVTYNIEEGPDIDVTVPVIFSPFFIDFNGDFNFPIRFNFGDIDFTGNVEFTPQFNLTINPQPGPRGTNNPVDELPEEEPEIPVEEEPPGKTVVGVVVQARLIGEQQLTTIATDNIPQILAPRCGSVKFGYRIAGRSYWSPDIDIKDLNCFIPCPFSQGAATVAASPAPGIALDYVPILGSPLATVADLFSTPEP